MILSKDRLRRVMLIASVSTAATVSLAACSGSASGSGTSSGSTPAGSSTPGAQGGSGGAGGGGGRGPAAAGMIAAITGTTMQVQSEQAGQVAVTWSASTKFSHPVAAALSALKAGSCVTAVAPSGTSASATSFTAATIALTPAANGQCGGGRAPGAFPSGQRPSGFPSGPPRRQVAAATGKVVSVSGSALTIAARDFRSGSTTDKTVMVGSNTKLTTEAATTSTSLKVGRCVVADGKADSSGTVTATTVRISDPVNGQCGGGFGGGGFGGGGLSGGANGGTTGG